MSATVKKIGKSGSVRMDMTGLKSLLANVQDRYVVRVGILGSKATEDHKRKETGELAKGGGHKTGKETSPITNAEIGLRHEKGVKSDNLPRRSWLEEPLRDNLGDYFKQIGSEAITYMLLEQPKRAYQELGIVCEQIVLKGFETDGYGKWKPLSQFTIANKNSSRVLVDTAQLKKSVTSQVVTL